MEETKRRCPSLLSHFSPPSYYSKKQRALRLSLCSKGRARGQGRPARTHTGLTFFCQAARLGGLSSSQLSRSLHILYRAGAPPAGREWGVLWGRVGPREGWKGCSRSSAPYSRGATPSTISTFSTSGSLPRWAQPLLSDSQSDRAPATRTQDLEPSPGPRHSPSQAPSARPSQAPSQPGTTQQR